MAEPIHLTAQEDERRAMVLARARAYKALFPEKSEGHALEVLEDLRHFCSADDTVHVPGDTHGTAQLEGRRQVWLRIQSHLKMRPEQETRLLKAEME
jgi:hypothetical protein